jgi:hypothetical protein
MLKYEELSAMWAKDSEIDPNDITTETTKLGNLHTKYYTLFVEESLRYKSLEAKRSVLLKEKGDYFLGNMDIEDMKERGWRPLPRMVLKADVQRHIDADQEVIDLNLKMAYVKAVADFLESIIRQINSRGYNLRLIFDVEKFKSGG